MCIDPVHQTRSPTESDETETDVEPPQPHPVDPLEKPPVDDVELAYSMHALDPAVGELKVARGLTFNHVTNQIWHFCSVDYCPHCEKAVLSATLL
jgi:hypothetical protein